MAALVSTYDGRVGGYYLPYEGLLAGFILGEFTPDGGTTFPVLAMSTDPTIHEPAPVTTPVTVLSYQDVMNGATTKWGDPVKYAQAGAALANGIFGVYGGELLPPSECPQPALHCTNQGVSHNIAIWNIMSPGSVSYGEWSISDWVIDLTSGAFDYFDWSTTMAIMQIPSTGDEFLIPLGGASSDILGGGASLNTLAAPIPAAGLLFSSGLFGLVFASRRRSEPK